MASVFSLTEAVGCWKSEGSEEELAGKGPSHGLAPGRATCPLLRATVRLLHRPHHPQPLFLRGHLHRKTPHPQGVTPCPVHRLLTPACQPSRSLSAFTLLLVQPGLGHCFCLQILGGPHWGQNRKQGRNACMRGEDDTVVLVAREQQEAAGSREWGLGGVWVL